LIYQYGILTKPDKFGHLKMLGGHMGRVYQSVKEVVQGTLQRRTSEITVFARATENEDSLSDAIEELDKIFVDGIHRLRAAISDNRAVALSKTTHAEQVIEALKANITRLEATVRETEDALHNQNVVGQKVEESLRIEIGDLQRAIEKKEEAHESRISEVHDLRSKLDDMAKQVTNLEFVIEQARREAASKAQEAEQVVDDLKANISGLGSRLKETEDTLDRKDAAIQSLERNLTAEMGDLQSVVTNKDQALKSREAEVNGLRSKLDIMAEQISQSQLAVHQAKREAASKIQEAEQVIEGLKANIIVLEATRKAQLRQAEQVVGSSDSSMNEFDPERYKPPDDLNYHLQNGTVARKAEDWLLFRRELSPKLSQATHGERSKRNRLHFRLQE
jgi:DNA repair exonuclease SbcCD ATPase subunit